MTIRKIQQKDLPLCSKLLEKAYGLFPYNETFQEQTADSYINNKYSYCKDNSFVAINDKGNILGFIFFNVSCWNKGLQAILEEVVVDPDCQSKGIGSELLERAHSHLKSLGVKYTMLWAKNDERLLSFYKKQGYSPTNDFVVMFKDFEDPA